MKSYALQKQWNRLNKSELSISDRLLLNSAEQLECWMNASAKKGKNDMYARTRESLEASERYLANIPA